MGPVGHGDYRRNGGVLRPYSGVTGDPPPHRRLCGRGRSRRRHARRRGPGPHSVTTVTPEGQIGPRLRRRLYLRPHSHLGRGIRNPGRPERHRLATVVWLEGLAIPLLCLAGWPWLRRMDQVNAAELAEMAPRVALLQRAAILVESSRWAVENLARQSTVVDVAPGEAVVRQGAPADAPFLIESGTLNVKSHDEANQDVELASLGPGDFFGEIGLLQGIPRTATVTATTPGRLLRIAGPAFLEAVSSGVSSLSLLEGAQARLASNPAFGLPASPEAAGS